ncbi:MAG: phosphodiester glycosidase family protein [Bacteroidota bacterium]
MGDRVNEWLDDFHALLDRVSLLPLVFQLFVWMVFFGFVLFLTIMILERKGKLVGFTRNPYIMGTWALLVSMMIFHLIIVDGRYDRMELLQLKGELGTSFSEQNRETAYFTQYKNGLLSIPGLKIDDAVLIQDSAGLEILRLHSADPLFTAFIATVDLTKTEIKLQYPIDTKTYTSKFAMQHELDLAINGEAGRTPGLYAPLGQWTGMYIVEGKVVKNEDNTSRPFMYFDKSSVGYYSCDTCLVTKPTGKMYNAIWGRFDLIMKGKSAVDQRDQSKNSPYPRTIMAIDKTGERGFFMVVDGRRPGYSRGLTMDMCAKIMLAVGAYDGMACDQGGSSTIYSKSLRTINRPADGNERPVYTHFGFKIKE